MKALKKVLCILLVLTFTVMCTAEVFADGGTTMSCPHTNTTVTRYTIYWQYDSAYHMRQYQDIETCTACGAIISVSTSAPVKLPHSLTYSDVGHVGSTGLHKFHRHCSLCGLDEDFTRPCSGPPCPYPY
jgi:hypothetical protein